MACWTVLISSVRYVHSCLQSMIACIDWAQAIKLFIASADELYGPITTLRRDGRVYKKIPWSAFQLKESDWVRVLDTKTILTVSSRHIPHLLSLINNRMQTGSSSISQRTRNQHYGAPSQPSSGYKQHGKRSAMTISTGCTSAPSTTA
jgi:hypothetical protein